MSAILFGVACFILGHAIGRNIGRDTMRAELVDDGHAEYYLDENNERQWRMKK